MITITFQACVYDDYNKAVSSLCDCSGPIIISQARGIIAKAVDSSFVIVSDKFGIGINCNFLPDSMKVDGIKVSFMARYIPSCTLVNDNIFLSKFEVLNISKSDSIFESGPLTIKIVNSQDYGYPVGFGFMLVYQPDDFTIVQKIVPYSLNVPFKTKDDAFKVATLMASKLENSTSFPEINLTEINFLKIQY